MSALAPFLAALPGDPELQQKLRQVTTAEAFVELASEAGFPCEPLDLVICFCEHLSRGSGAERVELFNAASWDYGELAWLLRLIAQREQAAG